MAVKINVDDYSDYGLGDIYYGLISFIGRYANENYSPLDTINMPEGYQSNYAMAIDTMKGTLKELLDYFKSHDEIYLPNVQRKVRISTLSVQDQKALEECCEYLMITNLQTVMEQNQSYSASSGIRR